MELDASPSSESATRNLHCLHLQDLHPCLPRSALLPRLVQLHRQLPARVPRRPPLLRQLPHLRLQLQLHRPRSCPMDFAVYKKFPRRRACSSVNSYSIQTSLAARRFALRILSADSSTCTCQHAVSSMTPRCRQIPDLKTMQIRSYLSGRVSHRRAEAQPAPRSL